MNLLNTHIYGASGIYKRNYIEIITTASNEIVFEQEYTVCHMHKNAIYVCFKFRLIKTPRNSKFIIANLFIIDMFPQFPRHYYFVLTGLNPG